MKMKCGVVIAAFSALAAGCANRSITLAVPFDEAAAKQQMQGGTNTVRGSALIRQAGGGIVTCAGNPVFLMPVTATAKEWAAHVYDSEEGGFRSASGRGVMFKNPEPFMTVVKSANCDTQGNFKFEKVADGHFYVFTRITWRVGDYLQGGSIMRPTKLTGGSEVDVMLSPNSL